VTRSAATLAVIRAHLEGSGRLLLTLCVIAVPAGLGAAFLCAPFLALSTHLLATFAVAASARALFLLELSAPLYGRQLARAISIVPIVEVLLLALALGLGALNVQRLTPSVASLIAWTALYSCAAIPVFLSGALRGPATAIPFAAAGYAIAFLPTLAHALLAAAMPAAIFPVQCVLWIPIGIIGLRQFGETLARYDPI